MLDPLVPTHTFDNFGSPTKPTVSDEAHVGRANARADRNLNRLQDFHQKRDFSRLDDAINAKQEYARVDGKVLERARNNHAAIKAGKGAPRIAGGRPEGAAGLGCKMPGRDDVWKNTPYADKPVMPGQVRLLQGVEAEFAHFRQDGSLPTPSPSAAPSGRSASSSLSSAPVEQRLMPASQAIREVKQRVASGFHPPDSQALFPTAMVPEIKQQMRAGINRSARIKPLASSGLPPGTLKPGAASGCYAPTHRSSVTASSIPTARSGLSYASSVSPSCSASQVSRSSQGSQRSVASQLDRLADLYERELLTAEEYSEAKARTLAMSRTELAPTRPGTAGSRMSGTFPPPRTAGSRRSRRSRSQVGGSPNPPAMNTKGTPMLCTGPLLHNAWITQPTLSGPTSKPQAPSWGAACRGNPDALRSDHPYRTLQQSGAELLVYSNLQKRSSNPVTMTNQTGVMPGQRLSHPGTPHSRPQTPLELTVEQLSGTLKSTRRA